MIHISTFAKPALLLIGVACGAVCLRLVGWESSVVDQTSLINAGAALMGFFTAIELAQAALSRSWKNYCREKWVRVAGVSAIAFSAILLPLLSQALDSILVLAWASSILLATCLLGVSSAISFARNRWLARRHPGIVGILAFAIAILAGAFMLKTPNAAANADPISWNDAFFTSASAVCVTGLITLDTEHDFSRFGQVVILILIQLGGLGIMTWAYLMAVALGESMSLRDRIILRDLLTQKNISNFKSRLATIIAITLAIEAIGAVALYCIWKNAAGTEVDRWFTAVFHAVSGYCNAGFSTFSENLMDARTRNVPAAISMIAFLVILGGLGSPVWIELIQKCKTWMNNL